MNEHVIALAEKLRAARRLLEEAAELVQPGAVAESAELHECLNDEAQAVAVLWGEAAGRAGAPYLDWVRAGGKPSAALKLGAIAHMVLQVPREGWAELAREREFIYRGQAALILMLRDQIDGRKGGA